MIRIELVPFQVVAVPPRAGSSLLACCMMDSKICLLLETFKRNWRESERERGGENEKTASSGYKRRKNISSLKNIFCPITKKLHTRELYL